MTKNLLGFRIGIVCAAVLGYAAGLFFGHRQTATACDEAFVASVMTHCDTSLAALKRIRENRYADAVSTLGQSLEANEIVLRNSFDSARHNTNISRMLERIEIYRGTVTNSTNR